MVRWCGGMCFGQYVMYVGGKYFWAVCNIFMLSVFLFVVDWCIWWVYQIFKWSKFLFIVGCMSLVIFCQMLLGESHIFVVKILSIVRRMSLGFCRILWCIIYFSGRSFCCVVLCCGCIWAILLNVMCLSRWECYQISICCFWTSLKILSNVIMCIAYFIGQSSCYQLWGGCLWDFVKCRVFIIMRIFTNINLPFWDVSNSFG